MHRINLVFHEQGHILFMPLGRFMTILGEFNVMAKHRSYARIADWLGVGCLLLSLGWGGWLLRRQFERLEKF